MNKDKIVLKNETAVELEVAASLESMKAVFEDMTAVDQFWKSCTDKNMSEVYFGQNRRWKDHGNIWYS